MLPRVMKARGRVASSGLGWAESENAVVLTKKSISSCVHVCRCYTMHSSSGFCVSFTPPEQNLK